MPRPFHPRLWRNVAPLIWIHARQYITMIGVLFAAAAATRWFTARRDSGDEPVVQFEEEETPVLQGLGLFRDGVLPPASSEPPPKG